MSPITQSLSSFTIKDTAFDIQCDEHNKAYLVLTDENHQLRIYFDTNDDVASFVQLTTDLEIANETFQGAEVRCPRCDNEKHSGECNY